MKYFLYLSLIFCSLSFSSLSAQTTAIPDTAFEAKLIQLGIDSDGIINGQVLTADVVNITSLNVSGTHNTPGNIQDLTGIEDFVNLTQLSCIYNSLSNLNLSTNSNLELLNCSNNNISSLDISTCISLQELYCGFNNLSSLNLNSNINLQHFTCNNNNLSTLDLSNNTNLQRFFCEFNNLFNLDLSNNINLQAFACQANNLSTLDLSTNTNLQVLYCSNSNLSTLDLSGCLNLQLIDCHNSNLSNLDFSGCISLRRCACSNNNLSNLDLSNNPDLTYIDCNNNQLRYLNLKNGNNHSLSIMRAVYNDPNLVICIDNPYQLSSFGPWLKDSSATYGDICEANLTGVLAHDANIDCLVDSIESRLPYHIIEATNIQTGIKKYTTSNIFGHYGLELDTGTYTIAPIPNNSYWAACIPAQTVTIDTTTIVDTLELPIQAVINCPLLTVNLSAPFLRATGGGSSYTVNYCNNGTAEAPNAYIEVRIDSGLNVSGASIPPSNQVGNLYTFSIDTLGIGECGTFTITVVADSNLQVGQTLCSEAHIYPDSICLPIWNDAVIEASATCQVDTIAFKLKNTGNNMLATQTYTIFEDDIIVRMDSFRLNGGDSVIIKQAALPNRVYRIEANQVIGFPVALGAPIAHTTVVNCNAVSSNLGILPQFYTGNSTPFVDVDCQQLIAAYDPNDKQAQPKGYGVNNYLLPNLPIDYKVRFQNTGNDTAFLVVVVDTLSPHLDIGSLQMGSSSHPYTWELKEAGILVVTFEDIKLVDSTTNEPLSNGFFTYSIQQQADLPTGTVINNQASIYFDYNPPIVTNTTFHTIARYFYKSRITIDSIICETDSFWINGTLVDSSGTYTETLTGSMGQDSTTLWNISILPALTLSYSDTACNSTTINGIAYDSSGIYTQILVDTLGCDTILTLDLTIVHSSDTILSVTTCDSFSLNGFTYTNSGTYSQTLNNTVGCDSLIILNLTIVHSSDTILSVTTCDSFSLNGFTYTNSGTYSQTLNNTVGCDSLIILNLTIVHSSDTILSVTTCDSFSLNGFTYTNSGTYSQTLNNTVGCDSLITVILSIDPIDSTLNLNGITLTANQLGASYQWLDCNNNFSAITGATSQSFTPIQSGDYAVAITKNNCSLISTCESITVVDVNNIQTNTEIRVYPNPTADKTNIDLRNIRSYACIEIFSMNGQKVLQQIIQNQQQTTVDLSTVTSGLYLLRIHTETERYNLKLIKK